ncbi:molecular chaperone [Halostagnicola sp. A56]|uniref:HEAT repeat domain-containing protein n=1 Tax=Halostagnicola sp. A56 TaxID=1495067 RepID=UPI00049EA8C3|nr:HEAT repeat domain-containing protein [Halostagnicola sp. A56]KDE59953.1 molecular chaperone [Halostagnicola sp. A56]
MTLFELERNADFKKLVELLESSSNPSVRSRAAEIIGSLESEQADSKFPRGEIVDALVGAANEDESEDVRATAIDALDQYGQAALEQLIGEIIGQPLEDVAEWKKAQALAQSLSADRPELRMAAATGLGKIGEDNVVGPLVNQLGDPDPRVRKRVARACGRIGAAESVPGLSKILHEDQYDVRVEAAYALADIGTDNAIRELSGVADADDETLRRIAVDALGRLGSVEAVELLAEALRDDSETVRRTAMFSLVQLLSEAPADASHQVREKIVGELEQANASESVQPLVDILTQSTETAQRRNAAWLLGRVADVDHQSQAQDALIDTLGDDDTMTSKFAATSLSMLDGDGLETRLLDLVENEYVDVETRVRALFVLGKIGGDVSRDRLSGFVDRVENDRLRKRGFSALSKLGGVGAPTGDFA